MTGETKVGGFDVLRLIVRDCCESERADPERPDTICIRLDTLEGIVEQHLEALSAHGQPVVDEAMVERAVEAFLSNTGQLHAVTQLQRDLTTTCMRAALAAALPGDAK